MIERSFLSAETHRQLAALDLVPGTLAYKVELMSVAVTDARLKLWRWADSITGWQGVLARHVLRYPRLSNLPGSGSRAKPKKSKP